MRNQCFSLSVQGDNMKKKLISFLVLITISTVFLGIGYASINNITLQLDGNTSVKKKDTVEIIRVDYKDGFQSNKGESIIKGFNKTMINSKIVLGNSSNSTITYEVTIRNDTINSFKYIDAVHETSIKFYDNDNIEYIIEGIVPGEILLPDTEKVILLTFKYKSAQVDNNVLNSYINLKFNEVFNIEYVNIDNTNLINSIEEGASANIEFINSPTDVEVVGDLDYEYLNGILSISNVTSDIKIIGKNVGQRVYFINNQDY